MLRQKNLKHLDLSECKNFERFPDIPNKLERLKSLHLEMTAINELLALIENLIFFGENEFMLLQESDQSSV